MADGAQTLRARAEAPANEVRVRVGVPDDVHAVMDGAMAAAEENGFQRAVPEKMLQQVWAALNKEHGIMGVIGPVGGPLEGGVLLRIGPMWYGADDDMVLEEKAIWVHPQFRQARGGRAARLAEFSKSVADRLGYPLVIGVLSNARTAAKVRLYERMFGAPSGAFFLYGARTGTVEQG